MRSRRQADREACAVAWAAFDRELAAVLLKNAAADGQSKSGTAGTRAESSLEDAGQVPFGDSRAGIAHFDFDARRSSVDAAYGEPSATGHEVERIECKIEQYLLEKMAVGMNRHAR